MKDQIEIINQSFKQGDIDRFYGNVIEHIEKTVIIKTLECCNGNQIETAKILGLHRNTLHNKLKKFSIDVRRFK